MFASFARWRRPWRSARRIRAGLADDGRQQWPVHDTAVPGARKQLKAAGDDFQILYDDVADTTSFGLTIRPGATGAPPSRPWWLYR